MHGCLGVEEGRLGDLIVSIGGWRLRVFACFVDRWALQLFRIGSDTLQEIDRRSCFVVEVVATNQLCSPRELDCDPVVGRLERSWSVIVLEVPHRRWRRKRHPFGTSRIGYDLAGPGQGRDFAARHAPPWRLEDHG